ncbi:hypothetical protein BC834DRAFT_972072 [Gloeopeniophorella convolvens]|nr:hypothetical protein BC834DRAFT_972072 [Gloeopeniophorella convolvens]
MAALIALDNTLGALLLAAVLSAMLYGSNGFQVYLYFTKYSGEDRIPLKLFVLSLWILDTASLVLTSYSYYVTDVANFGNYLGDLHPPWSFGSRLITDVFHNMHFAITAAALHIPCNTLITSGMVYYLVRNRNAVRRTNSALNLLAFYALNCGILNLVFSVVCFTLLIEFPNTLIFVPFFVLTIGVYFSSFMATLNSRRHVRKILEGSGVVVTGDRATGAIGAPDGTSAA